MRLGNGFLLKYAETATPLLNTPAKEPYCPTRFPLWGILWDFLKTDYRI
jgi:hypothetical protein